MAVAVIAGVVYWNVSNERILGERTAAKSADGRIESSTACVISGEDFSDRFGRRAVQVDADFVIGL